MKRHRGVTIGRAADTGGGFAVGRTADGSMVGGSGADERMPSP